MADDGLLMNFEVGEDPIRIKAAVKGGHWKQRRHLKKRLRDQDRPAEDNLKVDEKPIDPLSSKRAKIGDHATIPDRQLKGNQLRSREVISSLFTFNPRPKQSADGPLSAPLEDIAPSNAPLAQGIDSFLNLGLSQTLASHLLKKLDIKDPTSVQTQAIPKLVQDESDAFIQAQTGSGKTLAYLLPLVQKLMCLSGPKTHEPTQRTRVNRHSGLFAIILAPTRELAKQIAIVLERLLGCAHWLVAGTVIGGEKKKSEKARLRKGLNILIATPGRLVDHLGHTDVLDVSLVRWLILDEGDRLMELGFEQDIKAIVAKLETSFQKSDKALLSLPSRRTTILCSATLKTNVQRLGEISLKDAIHVRVDAEDDKVHGQDENGATSQSQFSAPTQLKQSYILAPPKQRLMTLVALLKHTFARKGSVMKAIVFFSCADSVEFHFQVLSRESNEHQRRVSQSPEPSTAVLNSPETISKAPTLASPSNQDLRLFKLHGSLPQALRTSTLASFSRADTASILVCTDVASRGLDLPAIDLVIEYDPAFSAEDHLHRIGRTARAGRDGRAIVFLMPGAEESYVDVLKQSYKDSSAIRILQQGAEEIMKRGFGAQTLDSPKEPTQKSKRIWEDTATAYQLDVERWILANNATHELARKAYISHVRAYATHILAERHIFDIKDMHLGHLAKSFGLREAPTNMGRSKSTATSKLTRRNSARSRSNATHEGEEPMLIDRDEAKQKMHKAIKMHMNTASEFNIG